MRQLLSIFSLFSILLFTPNFLRAITFVGGFENNTWTDSRNWSPQQIPGAGDQAEIPSGKSAALFSAITVDQLILGGGLTNGGGGSLTIISSFSCTNAGFSAPITTSNGCAVLWVGGVGVGADFTNFGDVSCNANVSLDYSKIINHGTFDANGTFSMGVIHSPTSFENYGLLRKPLLNGGTVFQMGTLVENFAGSQIQVQTGEIYLSLSSTLHGSAQIETGATLRTHGLEIYDGATMTGNGTYRLTGNGCFANNTNPVDLDVATVQMETQFGGTGILNISQFLDWRSGNIATTVNLENTATATLSTAGGKGVTKILNNYGTVNIEASLCLDRGTINNFATINVKTAGTICIVNSPTVVNNHGIFRKTADNTGVFEVNVFFENFSDGSIEVLGGTLKIGFINNHSSVSVSADCIFHTHTMTFYNGSTISGAGTYQINGNGINANNTSNVSISTAEFLLTNGNFNGTGFIECTSAHVSWLSASLSRIIFGSSTVVDASTAGSHGMNATVTNNGTMNFPVTFGFGNGTLVNNGTVNVSGANSVFLNVGGSIENHGIFRKTTADASIFSVNVQFKNFSDGSIFVENGTLRLFGFGEHAGSATVAAGAILEMTGFQIKDGATVGGAGTWKISNNGLTLANTSPVTFDVATTNWASGDIGGSGELILTNHLDWTSRNLNAKLTLNGTATLLAPTAKGIGGTLTNNGTVTANSTFFGNGTFQNNGTLELNATGGYSTFFKNAGTTNKNTAAGNITFVGNAENSGTLNALDDLLKFEANFINSGEIVVAAGATVEIGGFFGSSFEAGGEINGGGTCKITTGVQVNGDQNIAVQNFDLENGTLDGTATLTFSKNLNWTGGSIFANLEIEATGVVNVNAGGYAYLSGNLDNAGEFNCNAPLGFGSTTVVDNSGEFNVLSDGSFGGGFFPDVAIFNNTGSFSKNSPSDAYFTVIFNNLAGGSLEVLGGTFWVRDLQNSAAASIASGATLRVQGGSNLAGGSFAGSGTLHFSDFEFHLTNSLTASDLLVLIEANLSGEAGAEFVVGGAAEWRGGEISVPVEVLSGGVFTVTQFGYRNLSATLTNAGTVHVFGNFQPNADISNAGDFVLDGNNASLYAFAEHTFANTGSLIVQNNAFNIFLDMLLDNSGVVSILDAGLSVGFGLQNAGSLTAASGAYLTLYGNSEFLVGSTLTVPSFLEIFGAVDFGYPLNFSGEQLYFDGDVLTGENLTIVSEMQWDGGRSEVDILVNAGAVLHIGYFDEGGGGGSKSAGAKTSSRFKTSTTLGRKRAQTTEFQTVDDNNVAASQSFGDPSLAANLTNNGTTTITTSVNFDNGFFKNNETLFCEYAGFYLDGEGNGSFQNDGDWEVSNYFEAYEVAATNNGNLTGGYTYLYFYPDLQNNGSVAPGTADNAISQFEFDENYDSGNSLNLQILSNDGIYGGHDNIFSYGNLAVGGSLTVSEIGTVADGEFSILQCDGGAGCRTGVFSTVNLPLGYSISYTSEAVILTKGNSCNLSLSFSKVDATCFGNSNGSIFTTVVGGTAPFTYLWSNGKTTKNINLLAANDYTLTTTDAAGCTATGTATVGQPTAVSMAVSSTPAGGGKHNVSIAASGGTPPYTFNRTGATAWQPSNQFLNLNAGTYIFKTKDSNNCQKSKITLVPVPAPKPGGGTVFDKTLTEKLDENAAEQRATRPEPSLQIFPNPAHDFVFLNFFNEKTLSGVVVLTDAAGRELLSENVSVEVGTALQVDVSEFLAGNYFLSFRGSGGEFFSQQFLKM